MMNIRGKSDDSIVPANLSNKATRVAAETGEGRGSAKENTGQQNALRTQSRAGVPNALERMREKARKDKKLRFTALLHHVSLDQLKAAFFALKKKAAPGADGVTWEAYRINLEGNLQDLHGRLHRGAYRASPSRRAFISKADGRQRPLGIATLEDKIVQRAVAEVLNAIYEADFLGFSYGFRPKRNQHQALDALAVGIFRKKVNWVLDADIRGFFDAINHEWLRRFLEHRIADRRILQLIQKWLRAGILQDGVKIQSDQGSPQGATISPLLANVFLHYVFDLWVESWRRRCATGEVIVVRYADDLVLGFQRRADAVKFQAELERRLAKFGLELNSEKTRLLQFGVFATKSRQEHGEGKPETFDFLGFTHICGRSRKGRFLLLRLTSKKRMRATLRALREGLKKRRHLPLPDQGVWIRQVLQGYFAYYAVPTNSMRLDSFRTQIIRSWLQALRRRSQRTRMTWKRMIPLAEKWIPRVRVLHPWPAQRFDARIQGRSPVR